ncbi:MAG: hypothetical protein ABIF10_04660 [Candidatus Woesearchaeota archaeon]
MTCYPGTLKIVNKVSTIVAPETCDSEGRCIAACLQKAIPHLELKEF